MRVLFAHADVDPCGPVYITIGNLLATCLRVYWRALSRRIKYLWGSVSDCHNQLQVTLATWSSSPYLLLTSQDSALRPQRPGEQLSRACECNDTVNSKAQPVLPQGWVSGPMQLKTIITNSLLGWR